MKFALAAVVWGFTAAGASGGTPRYAPVYLAAFTGATAGNAIDINDNGIAVGTSSVPDFDPTFGFAPARTATRWDASGQPTPLYTTPYNWRETIPLAMNNTEKSAGLVFDRTNRSNGVLTVGGAWQWVPGQGVLWSVNEAGRAVGATLGEAIYTDNGSAVVLADQPTAVNSIALAISDNGVIVGYSQNGTDRYATKDPMRFVIGGAPQPLATNAGRCEPRDVNKSGLIVGFSDSLWTAYYDSGSRAAIFENGGVTRLELPTTGTNVQSYCEAINDAGVIVGHAQRSSTDLRAVAWFNRKVVDLQTCIDPSLGLDLLTAVAINNRGQILVQAIYDDDANPATPAVNGSFRLDPIRTPGDTNYDDAVNFADLVTLAQNYGHTGDGNVFWETGDFDFDWTVGFSDLVVLAQNYQSAATFDADWALAQSLVPEPAALAAILIGGVALQRRRLI